jgi:hypothetical protein
LNNTKIKVGIICPLVDEYNACKEILGLKNVSKISGRVVSKRRENNVLNRGRSPVC